MKGEKSEEISHLEVSHRGHLVNGGELTGTPLVERVYRLYPLTRWSCFVRVTIAHARLQLLGLAPCHAERALIRHALC
jgi:hypothetical protein